MNLSFVTNKISGRGGTETVLVKVLNHLARNGNNVKLILSNLTEDKAWLTKLDKSIKIVYPANSSKPFRLYYFVKIFFQSPNDCNYIILSPNIIKLFFKLRKFTHKNCRLISWFHFSIANQRNYDPSNIVFADYHLAISSAIKAQMVGLGIDPNRIFLIYNPAEHHDVLRIKDSGDSKRHLLYVGRVQEYGQKNLQELFNAVRQAESNIVLDIYGSGTDEEKCRELCNKLNINNRVFWHGWQNNVWAVLQNTPFAVILTSKFEGLPMVFLEAISRGIPCISADFDGYDDVINGTNGMHYHLGNVKECAQKINEMSKHVYDKTIVQNSISKFYEEQYFKHLNEVLQNIISY